VTEAEWMRSSDLSAMLDALGGEVSDSKLRLFACACCRRIWDVIDSDLHRRVVAYAEWFARGPGSDIRWLGSGHWSTRQLSCRFEQIEQTEGWAAIHGELAAEWAGISEDLAALRYDWWTPHDMAASTLHFRYDMPYYVARGVASIRTAPYAYWQHDRMPKLADEDNAHWVGRINRELASLCGLLRSVYGRPDLGKGSFPGTGLTAVLAGTTIHYHTT
jgi:hypothetical protein